MVDAERPLVLVIDDDSDLRQICLDMLTARGHRTVGAASVGEGLRAFAERPPAAVLLDLKLPDGTGLDVLRELQRRSPVTPVVVVSGYGSVPDAVEAMQLGASEYLEKPVTRERLYEVLDRVLAPVPRRRDEDQKERGADGDRYGMVGRSEAMRRVYQLVDMVAPTRARVLISGERGTGKELVARAIHALSPRRDRPFVQMNCAAVPAELIESEMFGHVKGAFTGAVADRRGTFESADGGTLFLDEIGDMSLVMQAKLLRVLQEGEVTPVGSSRSRARRRADPRRHQQEPARGDREGPVPGRSLRPPERGQHRAAPAAVPARGRPAALGALPPPGQRRERLQAQAPDPAGGRVPVAAALAGERPRAAQPHGAAGRDRVARRGSPTAT